MMSTPTTASRPDKKEATTTAAGSEGITIAEGKEIAEGAAKELEGESEVASEEISQGSAKQPPPKKLRATVDLDAPGVANYEDVWTATGISAQSLATAESLFGDDRQWFVRPSYVQLYDAIMADKTRKHTQIVNGTAGVGKSSFLLYALARCRCAGKSVLLHYQRNDKETAIAVFFPANGTPVLMSASSPSYLEVFRKWYKQIGTEESLFLVDGVVSFTKDDFSGVTYVTAKSPSCSIGFMEKDQNRCDRWLENWTLSELVAYATKVGIPNAAEIIADNWRHLGGVSRYAFTANAAQEAVMNAISIVGATSLLNVVMTGLMGKYEQQKVVDRLIHRHAPEGKIGVYGTTFTFASEFVATRVAMALCLETKIKTEELLRCFEGVGAAGGMRGVLFEAYAARKLAAGGKFRIKEVGSKNETILELPTTTILQQDTKTLNQTHYPVQDIVDKVVWPNPSYIMPAIDAFMLLLQVCIAFRMTVACSHGLDRPGTKAFLRYFDSVHRKLDPKGNVPQHYNLYVVVPKDTYENFSATTQPITGQHGVRLNSKEATTIGGRVKQWIMKIE